ncbi:MAG: F0F1 ATP synthase subunit epsilon [Thermodesulfobacteriota bacterium]|nr:F0F1 ATP synthase subunit epsilon [Thermodesulfobacteriota bacterium]
MATFRLELVTAEKTIYSDDVNMVIVWGQEGQLGILPHHAPLMTVLQPGELIIRKEDKKTYMAVSGGFLEILNDRVVILADACERAEEIDIKRAEEAKESAEKLAESQLEKKDSVAAEAALRRSLIRLKVAKKKRRIRS